MVPIGIHIGFPKAGSTFLREYFTANPNVDCLIGELIQYRETGALHFNLKENSSTKMRVISDEELSIWAGGRSVDQLESYNVSYDIRSHQQKVATQLQQLFPEAKILISVRSPHSLISSLYSQYLSQGGTSGMKGFLQESGELIFKLYDYSYIISMYQDLFGSGNVLVLPYELLRKDHAEFLRVIEKFFDLPSFEFRSDLVNRSIPRNVWSVLRLISFMMRFFVKLFPKRKQQELFDAYTERLYRAKESWLSEIGKNSSGNQIQDLKLIDEVVQKHYRYFEGLSSHSYVLPYIDRYSL